MNRRFHGWNGLPAVALDRMRMAVVLTGVFLFSQITWTGAARAMSWTLADANTSLTIDARNGPCDWFVDGVDFLYSQQYFYSLDAGVTRMALSDLPLISAQLAGAEGPSDTLSLRYGTADSFYVDFSYLLTGGTPGSRAARLLQKITVINAARARLDLGFFQASDFDLAPPGGADTVAVEDGRTARQWSSGPYRPVELTDRVMNDPLPDHYEAGSAQDIFTGIAWGCGPYDVAGPIAYYDVAYGFQWNLALLPDERMTILHDAEISPVPEPSGLLLFGTGLLAATGLRKSFIRKIS